MEILDITYQEAVAWLTINRPKALNALNNEVFEALDHFFSTAYKSYTGLVGVVLQGAGERAFVAGADIQELASLDAESASDLVARGHRIFNKIEHFHLPVMALVSGFALGGGCELAMACHLRLATPESRFGLPELGLGLIPGYGGTQRLVRYIGRTKALEYLLTSGFIPAEEALRCGLINKVCPADGIQQEAREMMRQIASRGPEAVKYAIQCVNAFIDGEASGMRREQACFAQLAVHHQAKEGLSAFLEKRKPDFQSNSDDAE